MTRSVILLALVYAFTPGETQPSPPPLSHSRYTCTCGARGNEFAEKQMERARVCEQPWPSSANSCPRLPGRAASRAQLMLIRAGYRSPDAMLAIRAIKLLTPIAFVADHRLPPASTSLIPFFILAATPGLGLPASRNVAQLAHPCAPAAFAARACPMAWIF